MTDRRTFYTQIFPLARGKHVRESAGHLIALDVLRPVVLESVSKKVSEGDLLIRVRYLTHLVALLRGCTDERFVRVLADPVFYFPAVPQMDLPRPWSTNSIRVEAVVFSMWATSAAVALAVTPSKTALKELRRLVAVLLEIKLLVHSRWDEAADLNRPLLTNPANFDDWVELVRICHDAVYFSTADLRPFTPTSLRMAWRCLYGRRAKCANSPALVDFLKHGYTAALAADMEGLSLEAELSSREANRTSAWLLKGPAKNDAEGYTQEPEHVTAWLSHHQEKPHTGLVDGRNLPVLPEWLRVDLVM